MSIALEESLSLQLMREITYLEPEKIKASGLTRKEMKRIATVSNKYMMSMRNFGPSNSIGLTIVFSLLRLS